MNTKSTLVLLVIAAVIGVAILLDRRTPPASDRPSTSVFRDVPEDAIRTIAIDADGRTIRIEKRDGAAGPGWEIVEPLKAPADRQVVSSILSDLRWLSFKGFVEEAEAKARGDANYGLDKPRAVLTCTAPEKTWTLTFGGPNPLEEKEVFVRAGGRPGVYVVDKRLLDSLLTPPEDLQDRTLVTLESWKVDTLKLAVTSPTGGEEAVIVKKDTDWHIEEPEAIREQAEYTPVNKLLNDLRELRWKDWVAEKPSDEDLKRFALNPPARRYTVSSAESKATESLLVGGPVPREAKPEKAGEEPPALVYVRKGEAGPVVTVAAAALKNLPDRVDLLRTRTIWDLTTMVLARIEVRAGDAVARLTCPKVGGVWICVEPEGIGIDNERVAEFVTALNATRIEEFYERQMADPRTYGFDTPAARLVYDVRKTETAPSGDTDEKKAESVETVEPRVWLFGEKDGRIFVKREDRGQVVEIKSDLLGKLRLGALLFRTKSLVRTRPGNIRAVKIERMERGRADYATYACARKDGQWVVREPAGRQVDRQRVNAAVGALYNLSALDWIAPAAPKGAYGLDKPTIRVSFSWTETKEVPKKPAEGAKGEAGAAEAGDRPAKAETPKPEVETVTTTHAKVLLIGTPTKDGKGSHARMEDDPAVFTLPAMTVQMFDQDLTMPSK